MIAIIIKASIVVFVLLTFYKLVLEKESFFKTNRIYLLSCLLLAGALPFVALPKLMDHQGMVASWINPSVEETMVSKEINNYPQIDVDDSNGAYEVTVTTQDADSEAVMEPSTNNTDIGTTATANGNSKGLMYWLTLFYLFGVGVLAINLIAQIIGTLYRVYKNTDRIEDEDCVIVNLDSDGEPCSFFKYIFINPSAYDYDTYEQIVEHEKIHVQKKHTWDLLFSEIAVILLWFNPFIWILRKEVEKNIEYQTDDILVNGRQEIKEGYQLNLVNIAAYTKPLAITTNYNQSLIKQRILKMNSKKSNQYNYWKYAFMAPLLFVTLLLLNKPQSAFAQGTETIVDNTIAAIEPEVNLDEVIDIAKMEADLLEDFEGKQSPWISDNGEGDVDYAAGERYVNEGVAKTSSIGSVRDAKSNTSCRKLLQAIRDENITLVRELVETIDVNCIDPNPGYEDIESRGNRWRTELMKTPLMVAAKKGNLEIAKLLVEAGATVDLEAHGDATALVIAASYGQLDMMKYLLSKGANINQENSNYGNILLAAASSGNSEAIEFLVSRGLDINHYSPNQGTPLIAAASSGNLEAVKYLAGKGADVNYHAPNQGTPLIAPCHSGQLDIVKYLLTKGAKIDFVAPNQGNALIAASGNGHVDIVKYLVSKGADVNAYSPNQGTALIMAANNGFLKTVTYLIQEGADVDFLSPNQGTALSNASLNGHTEVAKLLSSKVKDINAMSDGQGSALISAARNGQMDLVRLFLEKGADINQMNDGQGFALNAAATNGINHMIELLLENGAKINQQNDGQGSALNAAARNGHDHTIELLLAKGASIDLQNDGQGSALNAAARNGNNETIKLLLNNGAKINLQNDGQGSALNAAARNGHLSTVKLLVERGANIDLFSDGQGTALSAASKNRHRDVVDYLESKGAKHIYGR